MIHRSSLRKVITTSLTLILMLIFAVVAAYIVGVGLIGGASFSLGAEEWERFASFFNNMLSPMLAALAAAIAFFSLALQIRESRKDASLNEQITNYLNHIALLQRMIEKRWVTISNVGNNDWEKEPFSYINRGFIRERNSNFFELIPDILRMCRLFQDLADGVQWYTYLHKSKIDFSNQHFPRNEWSHFSNSLIQEQDKKMKYCFEVSKFMVEMRDGVSESEMREFLIYVGFYNHLVSTGTLSDR
jgi:preprotein translocase subunit SecG